MVASVDTSGDTSSSLPVRDGELFVSDTPSTLIAVAENCLMDRLVNTFRRNRSFESNTTSKTLVDVSVQTQKFKFALDGFAESTKVALDVLTALGEIHPFMKAPVIAFKLVLTLDLKRRENEARVQAMKVEMNSMMAVFLELQGHPDPSAFHADAGLQSLMEEIEKEIRNASSFCDYYINKTLIKRCIKSAIYEIRFAEFAQRFYDLGVRLHRQLSMHTVWGIYDIRKGSVTLSAQLDEVRSQLRDLFTLLASTRERELVSFIESSGGARACVENDVTLQELTKRSGEGAIGQKRGLREELSEDLDEALARNLLTFQGKLDIQLNEINLSILRESNRIITALSGGHERINDKDIREVWRDMGWKSTVKARHFVFALRDYYHGSLRRNQQIKPRDASPNPELSFGLPTLPLDPFEEDSADEISHPTNSDDTWALDYINASFLQPIAEAIDDDGSSFITTREINDFTAMRPDGCSALRWLAYWAAGWHSSVSQYVDKIYGLLKKFHLLRDKVRYENLVLLDRYLGCHGFERLLHLLKSTTKATASIHPQLARFRDEFSAAEEEKLLENLEKISYNLDSTATVKLVIGPYRIERYIYPLIYVLLKRHLQVIQLARLHTINMNEFENRGFALLFIFHVFDYRMGELSVHALDLDLISQAVFQQMDNLPKSHFERYAFGMVRKSGIPSITVK
ncbi:hypothetical protein H0H93_014437 [Arthromyces matolae]|nr:hypothetical protein H0H93_014437 [Arthromyces matolae]